MDNKFPKYYCLGCAAELPDPFLDLGNQPLANSYLTSTDQLEDEIYYPLRVRFCSLCKLVQIDHVIPPVQMFENYVYYSSFSSSFLSHAKQTAENLALQLNLNSNSRVLEIGSNDGYLLKYFKGMDIQILGVDPAKEISNAANECGIPTITNYFELALAKTIAEDYGKFDLIIGNNVLAHVSLINDFIQGVKYCLKDTGVAVFEVPSLLDLVSQNEFDTIYHEHVFYYSLTALKILFERWNLKLIKVEHFNHHGGTIRVYVVHQDHGTYVDDSLKIYSSTEAQAGLLSARRYDLFSKSVEVAKYELQDLLERIDDSGMTMAAYGAPAKGNTLLNYCDVAEYLMFTVDISPYKQQKFLPGSHLKVYEPRALLEMRPSYCLVLPWNWLDEIKIQQKMYLDGGGKFIVPIPYPRVI
jgi:SAM-dependent methyltransferase